MPERSVFRLPDEIPFEQGAILMCSSATSFHALHKARLKPGETVAVFGVGGLGTSAVQLAYALGALRVLAVDIDDDKLADHLRTHTFKTVVGDIAYGKDGEWAEPRLIWTQFQGIKSNDLAQFERPDTEVVLLPKQFKSGELIQPYAAGH